MLLSRKESDHKQFYFIVSLLKTRYVFNIYYFFHFSEFHFSNHFVPKFLVKLQTLHWVVNLELSFILWIEKMLQIIVFFKRKSLMGWQQNPFCLQHQAILEYIKVQPFLTSDLTKKAQRTTSIGDTLFQTFSIPPISPCFSRQLWRVANIWMVYGNYSTN